MYALAVVAASLLLSSPVDALEFFDFEPPYLYDPGHTIKDHCFFEVDGVWHCFYIRGDANNGGTSSENELGHATTTDFRHWELQPPAIVAGPSSWDGRNVWAPTVIETPGAEGSAWTMLYTGADNSVVQRMGRADAVNPLLRSWIKFFANPILEPDSTVYLWDVGLPFSAFRDPFYFEMNGTHHVLNTALVPDGSLAAGRRGVVHHATSLDLVNWTEQPPLITHNGPNNEAWHEIESVQLRQAEGFWHLFFSETNLEGVQYLKSSQMDSGWDFNQRATIDFGTAAEVTPLNDGSNKYVFSRHGAAPHLFDASLFWVLRVDSLRFDPGTGTPSILDTARLDPDWPVRMGSAFLAVPTFGDNSLERGETPTLPVGNGYVSSSEFYGGPLSGFGSPGAQLGGGATGTMKSRVFTITGDRMRLRVGGANDPDCRVALVRASDDVELFTAVGQDSPELFPVEWDISPHQGVDAYVLVEDASTAAGAYVNVDHIEEIFVPSSSPPGPPSPRLARLLRNHPNPFNPRTVLRLELTAPAQTQIRVFDARGRTVRTFERKWLDAGEHTRVWDGTDDDGVAVASGTYLVTLRVGGTLADHRSITLVR